MRSFFIVFTLALGVAACPSTRQDIVPDPPEPSGPPRGERLAAMVIGTWEGTAEDGTDTTEPVDLTLNADKTYDLVAGMVEMSTRWRVEDDLVYLEEDPDSEVNSEGICFRASEIDENRIVGVWTYGDGVTCQDDWYAVTLTRTDTP